MFFTFIAHCLRLTETYHTCALISICKTTDLIWFWRGLRFCWGWPLVFSETKRGSQAMRGVPCNDHFTCLFPIYRNYVEVKFELQIEKTLYMSGVCVLLSGYWSITVYGRKHCYRLYTKHFNEAVHWACAIQKIIDTKAPVETPTQLLIRDIEVSHTAHRHSYTPSVQPVAGRVPVIRATKHKQLSAHIKFPLCSVTIETTWPHGPGVQSFLCLPFSFEWPHILPPQWDRMLQSWSRTASSR